MAYSEADFVDDFSNLDHLEIAVRILDSIVNSSSELTASLVAGWLRIVIAKSYYASFREVRDAFRDVPELSCVVDNKGTVHSDLRDYLTYNLPKPLRRFADYFSGLRNARNRADYDSPEKSQITLYLAKHSTYMSGEIISNLDEIIEYLREHPPGPEYLGKRRKRRRAPRR